MVALSWICERSPISIHSLSPRSTAPHHTLASDLSRTRPITTAVSAIQYCASAGNSGCKPASSKIGIRHAPRRSGYLPCRGRICEADVRSGEEPLERLEQHHHHGAGHHAPEARRHGAEHDVLDPAPFDALSPYGVAHDDEWRREGEERHCREGRRSGPAAEQAERGGTIGEHLIAG